MKGGQLTFATIDGREIAPRGKHYIEPRGYAAPPGSGMPGQTCGGCAHAVRDASRSGAKRWLKCALMRAAWTCSRATDILAGAPACRLWERG